MGLAIDREHFTAAEYTRFSARLADNLVQLRELLARPRFGEGPASIGAEVELHLVDAHARPLAENAAVLASADDPRLTLEINRFNLEVNAPPTLLAGTPFTQLHRDLSSALTVLRAGAAQHGARAVLVGTLPTLQVAQLEGALTDTPRYRALSRTLRTMRGEPFAVHIKGRESLSVACDDVALEGANCSLQVHLRVTPAALPHAFNAAQLTAAPLLAACGNSPFFDGHSLWDETRIALFEQSVDTRLDAKERARFAPRVAFGHGWLHEASEQFAESVALHPVLLPVCTEEDASAVLRQGGVPELEELRLHHGTVWNWNRVVFDPHGDGHLRIEHRVLPSGPTVIDMVANAALALGLTLAWRERMAALREQFSFAHAQRNLQLAAKHGLTAELIWPGSQGPEPRSARALVLSLLPEAETALHEAGIASSELTPLFTILRERIESGRTGAEVQRARVEQLEREHGRAEALARMVEWYLAWSWRDVPVHRWPVESI